MVNALDSIRFGVGQLGAANYRSLFNASAYGAARGAVAERRGVRDRPTSGCRVKPELEHAREDGEAEGTGEPDVPYPYLHTNTKHTLGWETKSGGHARNLTAEARASAVDERRFGRWITAHQRDQ